MDHAICMPPCISFFDEGADVKAYVHLPGRKMYCGEDLRFEAAVFDRKKAQLHDHLGIRIIGYLFGGTPGYFDSAKLSEGALELRIDRTHEIAHRFIFEARKKRDALKERSARRNSFMRIFFSIHDHMMIDHLHGTERRAKQFFEMEIERAINFAIAIEED